MIERVISVRIPEQIIQADKLLVEAKTNVSDKVKELKELLIEYILNNMQGDQSGLKELAEKMTKLTDSLGKEGHDISSIKAALKSFSEDPGSATSAALNQLATECQNLKTEMDLSF